MVGVAVMLHHSQRKVTQRFVNFGGGVLYRMALVEYHLLRRQLTHAQGQRLRAGRFVGPGIPCTETS